MHGLKPHCLHKSPLFWRNYWILFSYKKTGQGSLIILVHDTKCLVQIKNPTINLSKGCVNLCRKYFAVHKYIPYQQCCQLELCKLFTSESNESHDLYKCHDVAKAFKNSIKNLISHYNYSMIFQSHIIQETVGMKEFYQNFKNLLETLCIL